jgi:hypothetical protein
LFIKHADCRALLRYFQAEAGPARSIDQCQSLRFNGSQAIAFQRSLSVRRWNVVGLGWLGRLWRFDLRTGEAANRNYGEEENEIRSLRSLDAAFEGLQSLLHSLHHVLPKT